MSSPEETMECEVGMDIEGHHAGLAKQQMDFHDAVAELIDNSISSNIKSEDYFGQESPDETFRVQVTIVQEEDGVEVTVADSGNGMPPDVLTNHIWRSGDTENADGVLNEHGFGLKNSLSVLTRNKPDSPFVIVSKTEDQPSNDYISRVEGPISGDMKVEIGDYQEEWEKGAESLGQLDTGTRVHVSTTNDMLESSYLPATRLETLSKALREHFGVIYRHFLEHTSKNHIQLHWVDKISGKRGEESVKPIYPVFKQGENEDGVPWHRKDTITVEDDKSNQYSVDFNRGIVDWEATREKYGKDLYNDMALKSSESPFRIYYKGNQTTQGADIVYNGRTLKTDLIGEIWDNTPDQGTIVSHSDYNSFTGEIIITDQEFETVNNKVDINDSSELWLDLKKKLNQNTEFHPIKYGETQKEKGIKKKLESELNSQAPTTSVSREKGFDGVDIDLLQKLDGGYEYIYEVKRSKAKPIDVYQCIMYWDAYSRTKDANVQKAILVARDISDNARNMMSRWNDRCDEHKNEYNLDFQPLSHYGLS